MKTSPDFALELAFGPSFAGRIAGVDEAGRGPLAGPVVAAAVILDPADIPDGLNDSKKLNSAHRSDLFDRICRTAHVAVAASSSRRIDATDIRKATLEAMLRAVIGLPTDVGAVLVDGRDVPDGLPCPGQAVVKGDARSLSIAAASIIAKVSRDRMMIRHEESYPGYGFGVHMGYGTKRHLEALAKLGPTPLHRKSFKPVAALLNGPG